MLAPMRRSIADLLDEHLVHPTHLSTTTTSEDHMSPASGEPPQTPDLKPSGGLAGVFKSLTGGRSSKAAAVPTVSTTTASLSAVNVQLAHQLEQAGTPHRPVYGGPPDYDHLYEQLKNGKTLAERLQAAEALRIAVAEYPLSGITNIWYAGKDLILPDRPIEARTIGFDLLTACVRHSNSTDLERKEYFDTLTSTLDPQDFHLQLAALVELAHNGKDLSGFQYDAIPLLTNWLRTCFAAASAARKQSRSNQNGKSRGPIGEETNLGSIFNFLTDIIRFSFNVSDAENTGALIEEVLQICTSTPVAADLKAAIDLLNAIITYGAIPNDKLEECIKVLCAIHCLVFESQGHAWRAMSNLCKSHHGQTTVRILLGILSPSVNDTTHYRNNVREIRGSLSVLEKLVSKNGQQGYPLVPFTLLMEGLSNAVQVEHPKISADVLHLILSLFTVVDGQDVHANIMEEDWKVMFEVVEKCAEQALDSSDSQSIDPRARALSPLSTSSAPSEVDSIAASSTSQMVYNLIVRLETMFDGKATAEFLQREDCIHFFMRVHTHLPDSVAEMTIKHFMDFRLCYPSEPEWQQNCRRLLNCFFGARQRPTETRLLALKAITDVFEVIEMMDEEEHPLLIHKFISAILEDLGQEKDTQVLQEVVSFAVTIADHADMETFDYVMSALRNGMPQDRSVSPISPPDSRNGYAGSTRPNTATTNTTTTATSPSNIITKGIIRIFMRAMEKSLRKCLKAFDELVWIVKSGECEVDARISAMKLLFRLRADWANRIFLTEFTESESLAAAMYRTPASLAKKQAADEAAQNARSSRTGDLHALRGGRSMSLEQLHGAPRAAVRTSSGLSRTLQRNHQMWMSPDPDALPEPVTNRASSQLRSLLHKPDLGSQSAEIEDALTEITDHCPGALKMDMWLDTIIDLLRSGCDWEVYSYILVHLPSQLSNHAVFNGAISQVRLLRSMVCEQIITNSFSEPPLSSGLRKADVSICLFQILTIVMSYHEHFSKAEEDEIVRTFIQGIGAWERAAKSCIHALSICCHELPQSTSKSLVTILQKMSQIITQSHVAVHILEFLSCLSRLPDLYSNFRGDEYRIVFGICFRYLQYVRDQSAKDMHRSSYGGIRSIDGVRSVDSSPNHVDNAPQPATSDELPQYVYTLAYNVITFWFLALRLSDRAGQVGWITKNLVSTDASGREQIDEQAQVTIDFMQRVAFADLDESKSDPDFTEERFGEILKKRWIVGNSIVTIEQSTRGGWAQIKKRQPSGTSCYIVRERFERPPPHQETISVANLRDGRHSDSNVILPSYLLLQLNSLSRQNPYQRPLPLLDDDQTTRAIRTFDRSSTVDGHKVGVIYIGENQTDEVEILANVMGSSDYTNFLSELGTLTKLHGATFNTQGLDREYNTDGEYAFCWRDRVTEIVFHVTTQMPTNLVNDPQCIGKKRHIGNDFVNIIFNNSGLPFRFDTFPSEFNYVNIVITPESRASFVATRTRSSTYAETALYKVQVMSKPGFPEISPAAETKIVSLKALPEFIRLLAFNASVFSIVWSQRTIGEHVGSWRNRLRGILQLKERTLNAMNANAPGQPPTESRQRDSLTNLRRASVATFLTNSTNEHSPRASVGTSISGETEVPDRTEESLVDALDFSKWT